MSASSAWETCGHETAFFNSRGGRRDGFRTDAEAQAVIDADTLINNGLQAILDAMKGQAASTDAGAKAQKLSLREGMLWIKANTQEQQGFQLAMKGRDHAADVIYRKSDQTIRRFARVRKQSRAAWKAAGFKAPKLGIGAPTL